MKCTTQCTTQCTTREEAIMNAEQARLSFTLFEMPRKEKLRNEEEKKIRREEKKKEKE